MGAEIIPNLLLLVPVQKLDALGMLDNTYVMYLSDNGFHIGG